MQEYIIITTNAFTTCVTLSFYIITSYQTVADIYVI